MCILSVYALLKVVGYYDLSVLSMSVMGFQKKVWMEGGWVGWALSKFCLDFWNLFNFAKPLSLLVCLQGVRTAFLHLENLEVGDYTFTLKVTDTLKQVSTADVHVFVKQRTSSMEISLKSSLPQTILAITLDGWIECLLWILNPRYYKSWIPLCYRFEDWAFSFSPFRPLLTQLYKWVPGYRRWWKGEWFSLGAQLLPG